MKFKNLLFVLASAFVLSCSEDDNTPVTAEKNLASTIAYSYFNGTSTSRIETYFADNKPTEMLFYTANNLYKKYLYTYGSDGQVSELNIYNMNGNIGVTVQYSYDDNHRIIQMVSTDLVDWDEIQYGQQTVIYTYNSDNTITVTSNPGSEFQNEFIYEFNDEGRIYKAIVDGEVLSELEYDGDNVLSMHSQGSSIMNYTYDNDHPVKGELLNFFKNQMNGYGHNYIINGGLVNAITSSDKYMIYQIGSQGENEATYQYTFDDDGYPIQRKTFTGDDNQPHVITEITYQ